MDKGTFIYEEIGAYGSVYYRITIDENGEKDTERLYPKNREAEQMLRELASSHQIKQFGGRKMKTEVNTEMTYKNAKEIAKSLEALTYAEMIYKTLTNTCLFTMLEIENGRSKYADTKDGYVCIKQKGNGFVFYVRGVDHSNLESWDETPLNEENLYKYLMKNKDIKLALDLFAEFRREECKK